MTKTILKAYKIRIYPNKQQLSPKATNTDAQSEINASGDLVRLDLSSKVVERGTDKN